MQTVPFLSVTAQQCTVSPALLRSLGVLPFLAFWGLVGGLAFFCLAAGCFFFAGRVAGFFLLAGRAPPAFFFLAGRCPPPSEDSLSSSDARAPVEGDPRGQKGREGGLGGVHCFCGGQLTLYI